MNKRFLLSLLVLVSSLVSTEIPVWFNHIKSSQSPLEFKPSNSLFRCDIKYKDDYHTNSLSEDLEDLTLLDSGMTLNFAHDLRPSHFCRIIPSKAEHSSIYQLIRSESQLEIRIDQLTFWVPLGKYDKNSSSSSIYTQYELTLLHDDNAVKNGKIDASRPVSLTDEDKIDFFYSVNWKKLEKDSDILDIRGLVSEKVYHALNIASWLNGIITLAVTGVVLGWVWTDTWQHLLDEDDESRMKGWLGIRAQVQKPPKWPTAFTSLVSVGWHLALSYLAIAFASLYLEFYSLKGFSGIICVYVYIVLAAVSGFICGFELFKHKGKTNPLFLTVNTAVVNLLIFIIFVLKSVLTGHFMQFNNFVFVLISFTLVYTPLYISGYVIGKRFSKNSSIRYSKNEEFGEDSEEGAGKSWIISIFGAFYAFCVLLPLLDSIIKSKIWFFDYDYAGLLIINSFIYFIAVSVTGVLSTYIFLEKKYSDWHWNSFITGSITGSYVFIYLLYSILTSFRLTNLISVFYYILYSFVLSLSISIISGTVSYASTGYFVNLIYSYTKKV